MFINFYLNKESAAAVYEAKNMGETMIYSPFKLGRHHKHIIDRAYTPLGNFLSMMINFVMNIRFSPSRDSLLVFPGHWIEIVSPAGFYTVEDLLNNSMTYVLWTMIAVSVKNFDKFKSVGKIKSKKERDSVLGKLSAEDSFSKEGLDSALQMLNYYFERDFEDVISQNPLKTIFLNLPLENFEYVKNQIRIFISQSKGKAKTRFEEFLSLF